MNLRSAFQKLSLVLSILLTCAAPALCQTADETVDYAFNPSPAEPSAADPFELGFVNVANGNLHIEIPLASFPQRGSAPTLTYKLVYDSRIWQPVDTGSAYVWQPTAIPGNNTLQYPAMPRACFINSASG